MTGVLDDIKRERQRQDAKWGEQNHPNEVWLAILTEEVGEYAESILHRRFGGPRATYRYVELTQIAAVAVAAMEAIEREEQ